MIVLMAGLPGTGKSTLARKLADQVNGTVLSKDEIRHTLFTERDVKYSLEQDDFCMEVMLETAAYILRRHPGRIIFLDGRTFSRRYQIERVLQVATDLTQKWMVVECVCSESTARHRLTSPDPDYKHPARDRDFALYLDIKRQFEPISPPKVVIDTDQPLEACIQQALAALS